MLPQEREAQRWVWTAEVAAVALAVVLLAATGEVVDADDARSPLPLAAAVSAEEEQPESLAVAYPRIGFPHHLLLLLPTQHGAVLEAVAVAAARHGELSIRFPG